MFRIEITIPPTANPSPVFCPLLFLISLSAEMQRIKPMMPHKNEKMNPPIASPEVLDVVGAWY